MSVPTLNTRPTQTIEPVPRRPDLSTVRSLLADRRAGLPSWVLLTQLFFGLGWMRAAAEKLLDLSWWGGDPTLRFLAQHEDLTIGWYQPFVELVAIPNVVAVSLVVLLAQLAAGASLLTGRFVGIGVGIGIFLNLNFVAAGAVNPSAFYLIGQGALALWMIERSHRIWTRAALRASAIVAATMAAISLPFISTVSPERAVEDPALMFITVGALVAIACDTARRTIASRVR